MATMSATSAIHATALGTVVDRVTPTSPTGSQIKITNRDASTALYYRFDGVDPSVGGADSYVVTPGGSDIFSPLPGPVEVRIIASLAISYSVTAVS